MDDTGFLVLGAFVALVLSAMRYSIRYLDTRYRLYRNMAIVSLIAALIAIFIIGWRL